jgi:plasmid maintenance system antidote protein VapI
MAKQFGIHPGEILLTELMEPMGAHVLSCDEGDGGAASACL